MNRLQTAKSKFSTQRVFWFWHFWVGLLLGPFIMVLAATGALYVFKDELETVFYPDLIYEQHSNWRSSDPFSVASTVTELLNKNPDYRVRVIELESGSKRAPAIGLTRNTGEPRFRRVFVSGNFQPIRGELPRPNFFSVVLDLHRNLIVGTPGRIIVELATCWLIVSTLLGIYLWWPKNWRRLAGVLFPRLRGKAYLVTRDLHSICGIAICIFLFLVACTGLIYSQVWGTLFNGICMLSGQYDPLLNPPKLQESLDADVSSIKSQADFAVTGIKAAQALDSCFTRISVVFPEGQDHTLAIEAGTGLGPFISHAAYHHPVNGSLVASRTIKETPPMVFLLLWNYPLHVGSFGGMFTKWLWLFMSLAAISLPVSGYAMTWIRWRGGKAIFPNTDRLAPGWIRWGLYCCGLLLPIVGASLLIVFLVTILRCLIAGRREACLGEAEQVSSVAN